MMEGEMRRLPAAVVSLLQSSSYVSSLRRAVEELVYNSLDSKATSVAVRTNHSDFSVQVVDNGSGITKADMELIGTKYMTSKCRDVEDIKAISSLYGFRGVALASLIDVSAYIRITSRHVNSDVTLAKVYRNGKTERVTRTISRPSPGTTVEIKGLLHNLEIQRKSLNGMKELQEIKNFLEHASIFHNGVSFSLRDDVKHSVMLKISKRKDIFQTIETIYDLKISNIVQELQIEKNHYKVRAYIGTKCTDDNNLQLIYLNGKHIINSKLHTIINLHLSKIFTSANRNIKKNARIAEDAETVGKSHPFFILFVSCPYNAYDMSHISNKTLIEFHSWLPINGLFKTLTSVFADSLIPKSAGDPDILENKIRSRPAIDAEPNNTKQKVTSIIERVLKSDPRKLQVQNGVKGKPAKRRIKKPVSKTSKCDNLTSKNKCDNKSKKIRLASMKPDDENQQSLLDINVNKEANIKKRKTIKKNIPLSEKNMARSQKKLTCKPLKKIKPEQMIQIKHVHRPPKVISKVFQTVDGSVKERCRNISKNAVMLMKKYQNFNYSQQVSLEQTTKTKKVLKADIKESIQTRSGKIVIREFIPFPKNCNPIKFLKKYFPRFKNPHLKTENIKSRYDLVQTIINGTNLENNDNLLKTNKYRRNPRKTKQKIFSETEPNVSTPILTYQSHHYKEYLTTKTLYPLIDKIRHEKDQLEPNENNFNMNLIANKVKYFRKRVNNYKNVNKVTLGTHTNNLSLIKPDIQNAVFVNAQKKPEILKKSVCAKTSNGKKIITENSNETMCNNIYHMNSTFTEYNFDADVNKSILLSLSHQESPTMIDGITENNIEETVSSDKLGMTTCNNTERQWEVKINSTYTVADPIILNPKNAESNINYISSDNINETSDKMTVYNKIKAGHNSKKDTTTQESCDHININPSYNIVHDGYGLENEVNVQNNVVEVTFASKSYPHSITNKSIIQDENKMVEVCPINVCETVMESSDMFDTSLDFRYNNDLLHANKSTEKFNKNVRITEMEATESSKHSSDNDALVKEMQKTSAVINGQVFQSNGNFDEMLDDSLRQIFHNTIAISSHNTQDENIVKLQNIELLISPLTCEKMITNKQSVEKSDGGCCEKFVNEKLVSVDRNGKQYFLDMKTGMTYPSNDIDSVHFGLVRRPNYVPKGLSPILNNKVQMAKELPSQEYFRKSLYDEFVREVEKCSEVYEAGPQNIADVGSERAQSRFRSLNASIVFDAASIGNAKVLKQVDNKFIACLMDGKRGKYLVLFDQHAVHERIRLETLLREYKTGTLWKSVACDAFTLNVSQDEQFYLGNFASKFKELGLDWRVEPSSERTVTVVAVPAAILGKNTRKMEVVATATKALVREYARTLKCTNGAANVPQTLTDLVNMEACRLAVKFGDPLERGACVELLRSLAECAAPFQCAHGRPDLAVLLEVNCQRRTYKCSWYLASELSYTAPGQHHRPEDARVVPSETVGRVDDIAHYVTVDMEKLKKIKSKYAKSRE